MPLKIRVCTKLFITCGATEDQLTRAANRRRITVCCGQSYKFTGKERDGESNLDNFGARYYSSTYGRFMTPDWAATPTAVPYANFGNPQSLNLYSYVQNNPISTGDVNGHHHCDPDTWNPKTATLTAGRCFADWWDPFMYLGAAVIIEGHHYIPRKVWTAMDKTSNSYKVLDRTVTGQLKNPRLSNSFDHLHRGLNRDAEKLVHDTELDLKKSLKDFSEDDLRELGARFEAEEGNIAAFNERLAELEPDAVSFTDAFAQALTDVYGAASDAAEATGELINEAGDAAIDAAEEGDVPIE